MVTVWMVAVLVVAMAALLEGLVLEYQLSVFQAGLQVCLVWADP